MTIGGSVRSLKLVVDHWLSAGLNASDPVTHWVDAGLGWVDLDYIFELSLASGELILPVSALTLALFHDERLWIFSILEHLVDELWSLHFWNISCLWDVPSWGKPSGNSSSHSSFSSFSLINDYNYPSDLFITTLLAQTLCLISIHNAFSPQFV